MPGRNYQVSAYRFSFNGKEDDTEANVGYQDYGLRLYDKRLGRFLSEDPLTKDYPWYSPYHFAGNSPIRNIDLEGAEPKSKIEGWQQTVRYKSYGDHYNTGGQLQKVEDYWVYSTLPSIEDPSKYYWHDYSKEPGNRWTEFVPNGAEPFDPLGYYDLADLGQNMIFSGVVTLASAGLALEGGAAFSLVGFYTRYWGVRASISGTTQLAAHHSIDVADMAGDALLGGFFANATFNTWLDFGYDFDSGERIVQTGTLNKEFASSWFNTALWNLAGNIGNKSVTPLLKEGFEKATFETVTTLPATVGEEGFQKTIQQKQ